MRSSLCGRVRVWGDWVTLQSIAGIDGEREGVESVWEVGGRDYRTKRRRLTVGKPKRARGTSEKMSLVCETSGPSLYAYAGATFLFRIGSVLS